MAHREIETKENEECLYPMMIYECGWNTYHWLNNTNIVNIAADNYIKFNWYPISSREKDNFYFEANIN